MALLMRLNWEKKSCTKHYLSWVEKKGGWGWREKMLHFDPHGFRYISTQHLYLPPTLRLFSLLFLQKIKLKLILFFFFFEFSIRHKSVKPYQAKEKVEIVPECFNKIKYNLISYLFFFYNDIFLYKNIKCFTLIFHWQHKPK